MSRRRFALSSALLLAACGSSDREPPVDPDADTAAALSSEAADPAFSLQSLAGEYRVAGIDDESLDAPIGIAVTIGPEIIKLAPCAGLLWNYNYRDGAIETRRTPPPEGGIICRITPEVQAAGEAIDAATSVRRTNANGIEFAGEGHSVLLFSQ